MRPRSTLMIGALAAALAGCAAQQQEDALAQARETYAEVRENPHVPRYAPKELAQAGSLLNRAEALARDGRDRERVAHEAYLAERAALTARETAMARAARDEIARADEERERALLEARNRQAQAGRAQAEARVRELEEQQRAAREARTEALATRQAERASLAQEVERLRTELTDLKARQTERGLVLAMSGDVLFDVGRASLKPGAQRSIDQLAKLMRERPGLEITVEGYTDSTGSEQLNERLSSERAHAVRWALVSRGVEPQRVRARGMGEAMPIASNDTAAGRQLNRRVEILVPQEGSQAAVGSPR